MKSPWRWSVIGRFSVHLLTAVLLPVLLLGLSCQRSDDEIRRLADEQIATALANIPKPNQMPTSIPQPTTLDPVNGDPATAGSTPVAVPALSIMPKTALEPLIATDNLIRVWLFDNSSKDWTFFDPRPAFTAANTVTAMFSDRIYWMQLKSDQTAVLNGKLRILTAGWNLFAW